MSCPALDAAFAPGPFVAYRPKQFCADLWRKIKARQMRTCRYRRWRLY